MEATPRQWPKEEAGGSDERETREIRERERREMEVQHKGGSFTYVVAVVGGGRWVWWQWVQRRENGVVVERGVGNKKRNGAHKFCALIKPYGLGY